MPGIEKFPFELVVPVTQNPGPLQPTPTVALTMGLLLVSSSSPVTVAELLGTVRITFSVDGAVTLATVACPRLLPEGGVKTNVSPELTLTEYEPFAAVVVVASRTFDAVVACTV